MADDGKVVLSELLYFVQNRIRGSRVDAVTKCCVDFYSAEDISAAKDLLFEHVNSPNGKRKIQRKGTATMTKEQADVSDVVNLLLLCDQHGTTVPRFASCEVSRQPPLSMDFIDTVVTAASLQNLGVELKAMRDSLAAVTTRLNDVRPTPAWRSSVPPAVASRSRDQPPPSQAPPPVSLPSVPVDGPTAPCASASPDALREPVSDFQVPKHRGKKRWQRGANVIVGKASADSCPDAVLCAAPRLFHMYLGRCDLKTTDVSVKDWINKKAPHLATDCVMPLPGASRYGYSAFKLSFAYDLKDSVLNADLWPAGTIVRPFYERSRTDRVQSKSGSFSLEE